MDHGTDLFRAICIAFAACVGTGVGNFAAFGHTAPPFRYDFGAETGHFPVSQDPNRNDNTLAIYPIPSDRGDTSRQESRVVGPSSGRAGRRNRTPYPQDVSQNGPAGRWIGARDSLDPIGTLASFKTIGALEIEPVTYEIFEFLGLKL
jgi:hypothetical protein